MSKHRIKTILWSILDVGLYPVIFMGSIPVFMNHMGDTMFGFWMLVNAILVTGQLLSMGLGTATYRNVSKFIADQNRIEVAKTISSNILTTLIISIVAILITAGLIVGITYYNWFHIESAYQNIIIHALFICVPLLIFKFIEQIFQNTLKAYEKFILANLMSMASRFGVLAINLFLVVVFNATIVTMLYCNLVYLFIIITILHFEVKRVDPNLKFILTFDRLRVKEEIHFGWWVWLQSLFVILTYQGDRFLVMSFFGPSDLAYYSIVSAMFNHIHMCFIALAPWAFPKIAKMMQRGENTPSFFFKFRSYITILALISLWLFSLSNQFIFTLWLGPEKYQHIKEYITLFIAFELFFVFTIVPNIYCNSGGYEKLFTKITFIFTSLNFIGMLVGYYLAGTINGLIWGLFISTIPGMVIQNIILNNKIFNRSFIDEAVWVFMPSTLMALAVLNHGFLYQAIFITTAIYLLYKIYFTPYQFKQPLAT